VRDALVASRENRSRTGCAPTREQTMLREAQSHQTFVGAHPVRDALVASRTGCAPTGKQKRRPEGRRFHHTEPYQLDAAFGTPAAVHCFSQALTVSCHSTLLCGFNTQWFSSGKVNSSLGMPRRCSAVNVFVHLVETYRWLWMQLSHLAYVRCHRGLAEIPLRKMTDGG